MKKFLKSPLGRRIFSVLLALFDIAAIAGSYWLALYIRCGFMVEKIPSAWLEAYLDSIPVFIPVCLLLYWRAKMYNSIWRLVSYHELYKFGFTVLSSVGGYFVVMQFLSATQLLHIERLPLSYFIFGGWLHFSLVLPARFAYRILLRMYCRYRSDHGHDTRKRGMLIGAGAAGQIILRDIFYNSDANVKICCIIDDNPAKQHCTLEGIPIVGGKDDILENVKKYRIQEILFAIPSIRVKDKKKILEICKESGCKLMILPGIEQLVNGEVSLAKMKDVAIEDLLGRDPIRVNTEDILKNLSGRTVLVTGGGGSIGSELCRQIAAHNPGHLIIFDIYENNAYDIEQELKHTCPGLHLTVLIGSVRDTMRIMQVFRKYRPEIVFHAAAHKHVPLMEASPCESIKNNVLGTYKTAYAAMCCGCRRFVLISTDKAVNPTNIMGASKRLCEMVIQAMNHIRAEKAFELLPDICRHGGIRELFDREGLEQSETEFVAVRFGNVLGSNGSVIPLFRKQLEAGGPLTVTHPDIIRYFMTIPEAVSLVLQAETFAKGGEIFVLDMGDPVKIDTLARNFIKLCGYKPDEDIKIEYTGLRPGEKLYEEKLMAEEGMVRTANKLIHVARPLDFDIGELMKSLLILYQASYDQPEEILEIVKKLVPTYQPKM